MIALSKAWWLLVLCAIFDAMHASINLLMMDPSTTFRTFGSTSQAAWDIGVAALAAGACAVAVGIWTAGKDYSWLLSLHGLALGAFGAILVSPLMKAPLSFRPVSLLFTVMAASVGAFALESAKGQRHGTGGRRFLIASGAASIVFAFSFIAVGFLISLRRLGPPRIYFIWMSSYFALCAIFMAWLAFRVKRIPTWIIGSAAAVLLAISGNAAAQSPAPRPVPAAVRAAIIPASARQTAASFELDDATGKRVKLSNYRGKLVLLDFWATECGGCVREMPFFMKLAQT